MAEAIALNLREMALLDVPIVVIVCGEGGSGGALGIAVGDRVLMQEFGVYSVIPPEGCAAILWRDAKRKVEAAEALKITAPDLLALGIIDEIVQGAGRRARTSTTTRRPRWSTRRSRGTSANSSAMAPAERLEARYPKFRAMGRLGQAFVDEGPAEARAARRRTADLMLRRIWEDVPSPTTRTRRRWRRRSGVPPVIASLLCQRGLRHPPRPRSAFSRPHLSQLHDPVRCCRTCARPSTGCSAAIARQRAHRHPRRLRRRRRSRRRSSCGAPSNCSAATCRTSCPTG